MANFLRKINRKNTKNDKLVSKKYTFQLSKISSLLGSTDEEIDKFFDTEFDEKLFLNKCRTKNLKRVKSSSNKKSIGQDILLEYENVQNALIASGDFFYDDKKYIITSEKLKNGSKKYFFHIVNTKPYLRHKIAQKLNFKPDISKNKIVFDTLKQKNLYFLKKPFEELLKYIHLRSLKIIMTVIFSNDRLYIRSCIEFYLQKYQIHYKRYFDNSTDRVRKYRAFREKVF